TKIQYGLIVEANDLLTNKLASQNSALIESNKILKVLNEMFGIYNKQGEPITIKVTLNDDTVEEALSDTLVPGDGVNEYFHETTSTLTADDYEDLNALYHTLSSELLSSIRDSDLQDEIQGVISKFEDFYTTEEIDDAQLILLQDNWQNDKDDDGDHSAVGASFRNSIIALESQNDNARDELRKAMFTFQEFYKTAASLIFKLTNVLEKIAGKI
ncbi:MAG: hypothetical protein HN831_03915, partial [Waddliaceae bacterium]|nr:hypothetical protein [Waddliaceae bacterium]